ncbi:unnamed protein product [Rhizophagus irregularis]|nr:unnamed protein product [Rhizophagus irregularis]
MFSNSFGALVLDFGNGFDFGNDLGFRQWFGISAMVWDFGNDLGFRQWFGISAMVWDFGNIWDFGNSLGFGILETIICRKVFRFWHIAERFRHPSIVCSS